MVVHSALMLSALMSGHHFSIFRFLEHAERLRGLLIQRGKLLAQVG
jgi:hypothetical protein